MKRKLYEMINVIGNLIVVGEALALLVGMILSGQEGVEWLFPKNMLLIIMDVMLGTLIIIIMLFKKEKELHDFTFILMILVLITHLYRDIEFFLFTSNAFCFNIPLFIVNNIKLGCALLGLIMGVRLRHKE